MCPKCDADSLGEQRIQCLIQLSKLLTGIFEVDRESSYFCWLYWKRFRMEKLVLNKAETNWFFSVSDSKTNKTQENTYLCRAACGVSTGRKFLYYIFCWGNSPCSDSLALHLMVFFFPGDEQTSLESLLLFQILFITYLNKDLTRVFFQVLIIVDCMANPSSSLDGVTGCWLI